MTTTAITATARIEQTDNGWIIHTIWDAPVDRTDGMAMHVRTRSQAERYAAAVNSGTAFRNPTVAIDTAGHTFIRCDWQVIGRYFERCMAMIGA